MATTTSSASSSSLKGVGLLKGAAVTFKQLFSRPTTQMYPKERPDLAPRTRGVIALMDENCTVCMLCARECPDWCIYIDSHKETVPPAKEGGRARTRNMLDRFAIDFSLCMYCGICVEVCPFDALWWSPEFEYAEYSIDGMLHEMDKLREWADTVPAPPPLDSGAAAPAEVADAIAAVEKKRQEEADKAAEAARAAEAAKQEAAEAKAAPAKPAQPEIKIEAGAIDQETFDKLIAEGKSERMARAKAKAAYVKKQKAKIAAQQEEQAAAAPAADAPADDAAAGEGDEASDAGTSEAPKPEVKVEAGEIDQETFDKLVAEGKSERIARAKAKAAYVKKERARLQSEAEDDA